jgi:hypothetical protein
VVPGASAVLPSSLNYQSIALTLTRRCLTCSRRTVWRSTRRRRVLVRKTICSPFRPLGEPVPGAHELLLARGHRAGVDLFRS